MLKSITAETAPRRAGRPGRGPTRRVILDLPVALHDQLRTYARGEHRDITQQIELWVERALSAAGIEAA